MPATLQDRWFSRLYLILPLIIGILSAFWLTSGIIGLFQFDRATSLLTDRGFSAPLAAAFVALGSVVDILLGLAILYRPWARRACIAMMLVALGYLSAAALFTPDLWSDPLGPMVKVIPSIGLALTAFAMLETR